MALQHPKGLPVEPEVGSSCETHSKTNIPGCRGTMGKKDYHSQYTFFENVIFNDHKVFHLMSNHNLLNYRCNTIH